MDSSQNGRAIEDATAQNASESAPASLHVPTPASDLVQAATSELTSLRTEYENMEKAESLLMKELNKMQTEEGILRSALHQAKETGREKMARERRERDEHAFKKLEAALLGGDDSSSDSDSEGYTDNPPNGNNVTDLDLLSVGMGVPDVDMDDGGTVQV